MNYSACRIWHWKGYWYTLMIASGWMERGHELEIMLSMANRRAEWLIKFYYNPAKL